MSALVVSSIGTFSFSLWEGQLMPVQPIADTYQRLGQVGSGVQILGSIAPPSPITGHIFTTTDAAALSTKNSLMNLVGLYVQIVEPDGTTWTNVLCRQSLAHRLHGRYSFGGVSYPIRVSAQFVFETQI